MAEMAQSAQVQSEAADPRVECADNTSTASGDTCAEVVEKEVQRLQEELQAAMEVYQAQQQRLDGMQKELSAREMTAHTQEARIAQQAEELAQREAQMLGTQERLCALEMEKSAAEEAVALTKAEAHGEDAASQVVAPTGSTTSRRSRRSSSIDIDLGLQASFRQQQQQQQQQAHNNNGEAESESLVTMLRQQLDEQRKRHELEIEEIHEQQVARYERLGQGQMEAVQAAEIEVGVARKQQSEESARCRNLEETLETERQQLKEDKQKLEQEREGWAVEQLTRRGFNEQASGKSSKIDKGPTSSDGGAEATTDRDCSEASSGVGGTSPAGFTGNAAIEDEALELLEHAEAQLGKAKEQSRRWRDKFFEQQQAAQWEMEQKETLVGQLGALQEELQLAKHQMQRGMAVMATPPKISSSRDTSCPPGNVMDSASVVSDGGGSSSMHNRRSRWGDRGGLQDSGGQDGANTGGNRSRALSGKAMTDKLSSCDIFVPFHTGEFEQTLSEPPPQVHDRGGGSSWRSSRPKHSWTSGGVDDQASETTTTRARSNSNSSDTSQASSVDTDTSNNSTNGQDQGRQLSRKLSMKHTGMNMKQAMKGGIKINSVKASMANMNMSYSMNSSMKRLSGWRSSSAGGSNAGDDVSGGAAAAAEGDEGSADDMHNSAGEDESEEEHSMPNEADAAQDDLALSGPSQGSSPVATNKCSGCGGTLMAARDTQQQTVCPHCNKQTATPTQIGAGNKGGNSGNKMAALKSAMSVRASKGKLGAAVFMRNAAANAASAVKKVKNRNGATAQTDGDSNGDAIAEGERLPWDDDSEDECDLDKSADANEHSTNSFPGLLKGNSGGPSNETSEETPRKDSSQSPNLLTANVVGGNGDDGCEEGNDHSSVSSGSSGSGGSSGISMTSFLKRGVSMTLKGKKEKLGGDSVDAMDGAGTTESAANAPSQTELKGNNEVGKEHEEHKGHKAHTQAEGESAKVPPKLEHGIDTSFLDEEQRRKRMASFYGMAKDPNSMSDDAGATNADGDGNSQSSPSSSPMATSSVSSSPSSSPRASGGGGMNSDAVSGPNKADLTLRKSTAHLLNKVLGSGGVVPTGPGAGVMYENQRYQPFRGWGSSFPGHLLPTDRAKWSTQNGMIGCRQLVAADHDLEIDVTVPGCDDEGWEYAFAFEQFSEHAIASSRKKGGNCYVRRRAYVLKAALEAKLEVVAAGTSNDQHGGGCDGPDATAAEGVAPGSGIQLGRGLGKTTIIKESEDGKLVQQQCLTINEVSARRVPFRVWTAHVFLLRLTLSIHHPRFAGFSPRSPHVQVTHLQNATLLRRLPVVDVGCSQTGLPVRGVQVRRPQSMPTQSTPAVPVRSLSPCLYGCSGKVKGPRRGSGAIPMRCTTAWVKTGDGNTSPTAPEVPGTYSGGILL
jgi:hypothetical protein